MMMKMKYKIIVILEKTYLAKNLQQANKYFQQDKTFFHPNWKIKSEMFVKPHLDSIKAEEE